MWCAQTNLVLPEPAIAGVVGVKLVEDGVVTTGGAAVVVATGVDVVVVATGVDVVVTAVVEALLTALESAEPDSVDHKEIFQFPPQLV